MEITHRDEYCWEYGGRKHFNLFLIVIKPFPDNFTVMNSMVIKEQKYFRSTSSINRARNLTNTFEVIVSLYRMKRTFPVLLIDEILFVLLRLAQRRILGVFPLGAKPRVFISVSSPQ